MSAFVCRGCQRVSETSAPEKWEQKYPALRDLCPECISLWIVENVREDREPEPTGGFLDGIKGAGEK